MEGRPVRVVMVDDHEMVLEGLKAMLARFAGRVRVVGQAASAEEAQPMVAALSPDVVLCDVRLRGSSGLDLCRRLIEAEMLSPAERAWVDAYHARVLAEVAVEGEAAAWLAGACRAL